MLRKLLFFILVVNAAAGLAQSRIAFFTAVNMTDSIRLKLMVTPGPQCSGFQILKGSDSVNLYPVYVYPDLCGSPGYSQTYTFTDISPNFTAPNYYRVLIPPGDYSPVLKVNSAANYSNLVIFPQPAGNTLNITVANLLNFYYEMTIYDRFGRKQGFASGNAAGQISIDVSAFEAGVYIFYIIDGNNNAYRGKFIKTPAY